MNIEHDGAEIPNQKTNVKFILTCSKCGGKIRG